jgi:transposase
VSIDMSPAFINGVTGQLPNARITFEPLLKTEWVLGNHLAS